MPTTCEPWTRPVTLAQQRSRVLEGEEVITLNDLEIRDSVSIPVAPLSSFHHRRLQQHCHRSQFVPVCSQASKHLDELVRFVRLCISINIEINLIPPPSPPRLYNKRLPQEVICSGIGRFGNPCLVQCGQFSVLVWLITPHDPKAFLQSSEIMLYSCR